MCLFSYKWAFWHFPSNSTLWLLAFPAWWMISLLNSMCIYLFIYHWALICVPGVCWFEALDVPNVVEAGSKNVLTLSEHPPFSQQRVQEGNAALIRYEGEFRPSKCSSRCYLLRFGSCGLGLCDLWSLNQETGTGVEPGLPPALLLCFSVSTASVSY